MPWMECCSLFHAACEMCQMDETSLPVATAGHVRRAQVAESLAYSQPGGAWLVNPSSGSRSIAEGRGAEGGNEGGEGGGSGRWLCAAWRWMRRKAIRAWVAAMCAARVTECAGPAAEEAGLADSARIACGELGGEGGAEGGPVVGWELGGASAGVAVALRRLAMSRRLLVDRVWESSQ